MMDITLFLCGDVMTGRGIDQVLPFPVDPTIHEPFMNSAMGYVRLAETVHGPIPRPVSFPYIWGDALEEFSRIGPDVRIINLETAITRSDDYWEDKGINYRMSPENVPCLIAAGIDCCSLANNHVLDWGYVGLQDTLSTLRHVSIQCAGAGRTCIEAEQPAILDVAGKGRVLVFSFGSETSGIPRSWKATESRGGVQLLPDLSEATIAHISERVRAVKKNGDVIVASIHWGGNWGYDIPERHKDFAHMLIDKAQVDIVHGHSSHHVMGIEIYHHKLILYGCGDFISDYEGIRGYERYRSDLGLMYFARVDPSKGLVNYLHMTPTQVRNFRIRRAGHADVVWLQEVLNREGKQFGTNVYQDTDGTLVLQLQ